MKVIHIESGLGNQMLSYCEYLAMKKVHPNEECYIETLTYEIDEAAQVFCQWNGYELERIFGIDVPNIKMLFSDKQWNQIIYRIRESCFWRKNWNWPVHFSNAFSEQGVQLHNIRGDFEKEQKENEKKISNKIKETHLYKMTKNTYLNANIRRIYKNFCKKDSRAIPELLFYEGTENVFAGQQLAFAFNGNQIERVEEDIQKAFVFPQLDERNKQFAKKLDRCESVAVHVRRGDMLSLSGRDYVSGYFRRAVRYINRHVNKPSFFFFCDPGSEEWCKQNPWCFGLDFKKENIEFVNWNRGESSYRDMQLMSMCKHNIITESSFGWWGAYLNKNPNKITISPEIEINTTHHM